MSIDEVIKEVIPSLQNRFEAKRIDLSLQLEKDLWITGDASRLKQVFFNLLTNAILYTQEGGHIEVRAFDKENRVIVEVEDNGIGINPEEIPRIFERFYRVDKARSRNSGGTGLGLAIVKHIIEAHDGEIFVKSKANEGTTFTVFLNKQEEDDRFEEKIVLIDGNSIAYRAFFALPLLNNNKGVHTNAVYGFAMMLLKVLKEEQPTHLLVAFDAGKTTFRHQTYSDYKGGRQKTPSELSEQFPYIRELLKAYGIAQYELENYEADDIIGTLSLQAEKDGYEIKIYSGDKDLTQLASDATTVCITRKGITDIEEYTPAHVEEKYGLTPEQIIDMKGLMGDSSDNIPGVPGVGEKTAIKLLKQFGSVENLLASIDEVSGKKLQEKLREHENLALMSKELATILREVPINFSIGNLEYHEADNEKVYELFKELEFNSLLEKLDRPVEEASAHEDVHYESVTELTDDLFSGEDSFYLEMITENYHRADIAGFGISGEKGTYFIPAEAAFQSAVFKKWAEDETKKKSVYDAKRTIIGLRRYGIELKGIDFDIWLASYLLNPSESPEDFAAVAKLHGISSIQSDEAVYGKGAKRQLPEGSVYAEHIASKAAAIEELKAVCLKELEENQQLELFYELELPLALILADMESEGVQVDINRLKEMGEELKGKLADIEKTIYSLAGTEFNINSPKQLGTILFEKLGLPPIKKQKQVTLLRRMCLKNWRRPTKL